MGHYLDLVDIARSPAQPREMPDPRADLLDDSNIWRRLLRMAWELDGDRPVGLCANLTCLRCLGARLVPDRGHLRFRSSGDYWSAESAFQTECREALAPYSSVLRTMLRALETQDDPRLLGASDAR